MDPTLELAETVQPHKPGRSFVLKANALEGEHHIVARLGQDGPILDSCRVNTFLSSSGIEGGAHIIENGDGYNVWEMHLLMRNLPADVEIRMVALGAGVEFDANGGTTLSVYASDFVNGEYVYTMTASVPLNSAACHMIQLYQDGQPLGEAFSASEFMGIE